MGSARNVTHLRFLVLPELVVRLVVSTAGELSIDVDLRHVLADVVHLLNKLDSGSNR